MGILSEITSLTNDLIPLSDHSPSIFEITQIDANNNETYPLILLTWNKLNKGHSSDNCYYRNPSYSNNPFNKDESTEDYYARMDLEYDFILTQITKKNLSVILLQEINDLVFSSCIAKTTQCFFQKLNNLNWNYLLTTKELNTKPMAILFNSERLSYCNEKRGILVSDTGKNHGFEAKFFDRINKKILCIATCHLDFAYDFSKEILRYQQEQRVNNIFSIIAGDINRTPDQNFPSFFGNMEYPSHIKKENDELILEKFDCITATPEYLCKVLIEEKIYWYFAKNDNQFFLKSVESPTTNRRYFK